MDRKHSTPELNTGPTSFASTTKLTLKKALKSPIKMASKISASILSPSKPKTPAPPTHHETQRHTLTDNAGPSQAGAIPTLNLQRASGGFQDPFIDRADADGEWVCCVCGTSNDVHIYPGAHPLGALACDCLHKPCHACKVSGQVKPFLPMTEPAMVPCGDSTFNSDRANDNGKGKGKATTTKANELRFGIICPSCGLSWRARESGKRFSKTLRKMPSVSLHRATYPAPPGENKLRKSRSTLVLGNKRIVTPPGTATPAKQAEYAAVRFSGVTCTCGTNIELVSALCFQIVGEQVDQREREAERKEKGLWVKAGNSVGWTTTPELKAKGHGTPVLRIRGVEHPNPLRSCPVVDKNARDSWEEKCDREGWI